MSSLPHLPRARRVRQPLRAMADRCVNDRPAFEIRAAFDFDAPFRRSAR